MPNTMTHAALTSLAPLSQLENATEFQARHLGPWEAEQAHMLSVIGVASREALMQAIVPDTIRRNAPMDLPAPLTEAQALNEAVLLITRKMNRLAPAEYTKILNQLPQGAREALEKAERAADE